MIYINIDLGPLLALSQKDFRGIIERSLSKAAEDMAVQAHGHIVEQVQEKLHSSRAKYLEALTIKQVNPNVWMVVLDPKAMWIEEGMSQREMIDDILKSDKAKTSRDGSKYLSVPFEHNKGPTQQTPAATDLTNAVKDEMKRRKIPYGKIEMDSKGKPKQGLLHRFDILHDPIKTGQGAGQGHGPVGAVRQGMTGTPFLQRVAVYQRAQKDPATGKDVTKKSIMTFRTVSSNQKGSGMWVHPGFDAKKFFEEAEQWCLEQWEQRIKNDVIDRILAEL